MTVGSVSPVDYDEGADGRNTTGPEVTAPSVRRRGLHARRARQTPLVLGLMAGIAFLVAVGAAAAIAIASASIPGASKGTVPSALSPRSASAVAHRVNVSPSALPADWVVDRTRTGPLRAFLDGSQNALGAGSSIAVPMTPVTTPAATRFERCLGVKGAGSLFGGSETPIARASSPAYESRAQASSVEEVGSSAAVYLHAAPVRTAAALLGHHAFARCFGAAVGAAFDAHATPVGGDKASYGSPTVQALPLPQGPSARAAGVALTIPVTQVGATVDVSLAFVLIDGGHVQTDLYAVSVGRPLTRSLTRRLAAGVEGRVARSAR